jgi:hypothetical protein
MDASQKHRKSHGQSADTGIFQYFNTHGNPLHNNDPQPFSGPTIWINLSGRSMYISHAESAANGFKRWSLAHPSRAKDQSGGDTPLAPDRQAVCTSAIPAENTGPAG